MITNPEAYSAFGCRFSINFMEAPFREFSLVKIFERINFSDEVCFLPLFSLFSPSSPPRIRQTPKS